MRILIINYEFPPLGGGAGNATYYLAKHLCKMGHSITVLTSAFQGLPSEGRIQGVNIFRIPVIRKRIDRCNVFEMLTFMVSAMFHCDAVVERFKPEKVVAFFGLPSGAVALWIKKRFKIPYILSLRGGDVPGFLSERLYIYHLLTKPLIRLVWKHAGQVVANSVRLRKLARCFSPNLEIPTIPNGVDIEQYKPQITKSNGNIVKILTVGRLLEQKGIEYLLGALSILKKNGFKGNYSLEIVGDGPLRKSLEQMAKELSIDDNVIFSGWVSRRDMPKKYQSADLFVLPSLDEGMPNAILEAMASKLPVITTSILRDEALIKDGYNGFFVPPKSTSVLFEKINLLLRNKQLREDMGERSIQLVKSKYLWKDVACEYSKNLLAI
ncbi:MAG: glycosyltransferase family 4 protein [Thermodesulfobacteriota bacterium]